MSAPVIFPLAGRRVYVAGHGGMVGAALLRRLARADCQVLTSARSLDLRQQEGVRDWMAANRPEVVIIAAAKVGGIAANAAQPGAFLYDNLMIAANLIEASRIAGVAKLLCLGSSCIYPKFADQPIGEDALLTGPLEPTNEAYALAKIAAIRLCDGYRRQYGCDFISAMPSNLYGPGDNFDPLTSHVLPALIRKAYDARVSGAGSLTIWGTGTPRREFLHVDDLADACLFLLERRSAEGPINVGSGKDIAIIDLARLVARVVGFTGDIRTDPAQPDGTPRKLMDGSRLATMGWAPRIALADGIADAYARFVAGEARGLAQPAPAFDARAAPTLDTQPA